MTEQDYYAQFVGDEPEVIGYFRASLQWPIVTEDMLDRLNSLMLEYAHAPSELLDAPRLGSAGRCYIYGRHTYQMLLGGRRCITCGKQEAVPICEDGTHIWGAPVLGPTICVVCGTAKPVVPPRCDSGDERDNCGALYCMEEHDWIKKSDGNYYCPICRMDRP